ncbi:MAG TPA: hypothetical protein VGS80_13020, partial [Ktedonobacterales bacterium]|nr:hypothetical protein [Ktedonobacterales bacterium]
MRTRELWRGRIRPLAALSLTPLLLHRSGSLLARVALGVLVAATLLCIVPFYTALMSDVQLQYLLATAPKPHAAAVALLGTLDFVSAVVTPHIRTKLHHIFHYVPLGPVSETENVLVAIAAIGLLALARGIRRGQRLAWFIAMGLLGSTAVLHLAKNGGIVQSAAA